MGKSGPQKSGTGKSLLPARAPHKPDQFTLPMLYAYLSRGKVELGLSDQGELTVSYDGDALPDWMTDLLRIHKDALIKTLKMRKLFRAIDERICLMRYENPPKGTRDMGLRYLAKMLADFKALCDLPEGYTDHGDIFADCALTTLQGEYEELTRPDAPYPIPADDPRERYPNGKLFV